MEYSSAAQALESKALDAQPGVSAGVDDLLDKTFGGGVKAEDLVAFRFTRPASALLDLAPGPHRIAPFDLDFKVEADGSLSTVDPRLQVDAKARVVRVLCYPVTLKLLEAGRSAAGPLQLSYGSTGLLSGLANVLAEYDKQNSKAVGSSMKVGFRRVTAYLPVCATGGAYEVNGVKFELAAGGRAGT